MVRDERMLLMNRKWVKYEENTEATGFSGNGQCYYQYMLGDVCVGEVGRSWYSMKVAPDDVYQAIVHLPGVDIPYALYPSIEIVKRIVESEVDIWLRKAGLA